MWGPERLSRAPLPGPAPVGRLRLLAVWTWCCGPAAPGWSPSCCSTCCTRCRTTRSGTSEQGGRLGRFACASGVEDGVTVARSAAMGAARLLRSCMG